jgi:hypothetical protein
MVSIGCEPGPTNGISGQRRRPQSGLKTIITDEYSVDPSLDGGSMIVQGETCSLCRHGVN